MAAEDEAKGVSQVEELEWVWCEYSAYRVAQGGSAQWQNTGDKQVSVTAPEHAKIGRAETFTGLTIVEPYSDRTVH